MDLKFSQSKTKKTSSKSGGILNVSDHSLEDGLEPIDREEYMNRKFKNKNKSSDTK